MTQDSMTGRTQSMVAKTTQFGNQPSRTALASRSLTAAGRLTGEAQRTALRNHFEAFPPSIGSSCPHHPGK